MLKALLKNEYNHYADCPKCGKQMEVKPIWTKTIFKDWTIHTHYICKSKHRFTIKYLKGS